jgi:hypothetical protein
MRTEDETRPDNSGRQPSEDRGIIHDQQDSYQDSQLSELEPTA